jgi:hypothetical protein
MSLKKNKKQDIGTENKGFDEESFKTLQQWIEDNKKTLSPAILHIFSLLLPFLATALKFKNRKDNLKHIMAQFLGIRSKSEKQKPSSKPVTKKKLSPEEKAKKAAAEKEARERRLKEISEYYSSYLKNTIEGLKMKKSAWGTGEKGWITWYLGKLKDRKGMTVSKMKQYTGIWENSLDLPCFKASVYIKESEDFKIARFSENLFGKLLFSEEKKETYRTFLNLPPQDATRKKAIRKRPVKEFRIEYRDIEIEQEYYTDGEGRRHYAKDLKPIAPPYIGYTYTTIINIMLMTVSFGIPLNRLEKMFSGFPSGFSSSGMWDLLEHAAGRFLPVYLQLGKELNYCRYLKADDTYPKVLELARINDSIEIKDDEDNISELRKEVENIYPLISKKEDGNLKKKILTSLVTGTIENNKESSRILFFRTHKGSVGNLLDHIFEQRDSLDSSKIPIEIHLTSDLSKENIPSLEVIKKRDINLDCSGCLAHARRGIFRNRKADPEITEKILKIFEEIYSIEEYIKTELDNSYRQTVEARRTLSYRLWQLILIEAKKLSSKWPQSDIKKAADYIINNHEYIEKFLKDGFLDPDNNYSERALRPEKIFKNNRLFCRTVHGRTILDILLSVIRTATAAGVNMEEYLLYVFQAPPELVKTSPEKYTPYSFSCR